MADLKTKQNDGNVMHFLRTVEHDERREGDWFKAAAVAIPPRASLERAIPSLYDRTFASTARTSLHGTS